MWFVITQIWPYLLAAFALGSVLALCLNQIFKSVMLKSEFPAPPDFSRFALKSDIPNPSQYALKTDLPALPDFTTFATKSEIPAVNDAEIAELRHQVARLEQRMPADDLQLIDGVSPELESRLHAHGITLFRQIAQWNDEDIDRIATVLDASPGQVRLENWVAHARSLHHQKYGQWLAEYAARGASPAAAPAPFAGHKPYSIARDDLKLISGVGPVLEQRLHSLGITTFEQVASWTAQDIEEIAIRLETAPERIARERWVDHARRLMKDLNAPPPVQPKTKAAGA